MFWGPRAFLPVVVGVLPSVTTPSCFCCFQESPAAFPGFQPASEIVFFLLKCLALRRLPPQTSNINLSRSLSEILRYGTCWLPMSWNMESTAVLFHLDPTALLLFVTSAHPGHWDLIFPSMCPAPPLRRQHLIPPNEITPLPSSLISLTSFLKKLFYNPFSHNKMKHTFMVFELFLDSSSKPDTYIVIQTQDFPLYF